MNIFVSLRQLQKIWYQQELNEADRQEEIIEQTMMDSEDQYENWKQDLRKYFLDNFTDYNRKLFDECRRYYLEMPETNNHLDDWQQFISYSINYIESNYL